MQSFVKIKSSPNAEITLSFTEMGKSCHSPDFLLSQICILTLFAKIRFSRKFPDLQYLMPVYGPVLQCKAGRCKDSNHGLPFQPKRVSKIRVSAVCLTRDRGTAGSGLTGVTALCPSARHINPSLVLVQHRKTRPFITERLLIGPLGRINWTPWENQLDPLGEAIGPLGRISWTPWEKQLDPLGEAIGPLWRSNWTPWEKQLDPLGEAIGPLGRINWTPWENQLDPLGEAIGPLGRISWTPWEKQLDPLGEAIGPLGRSNWTPWEKQLDPLGEAIGPLGRISWTPWEKQLDPLGEAIGPLGRSNWTPLEKQLDPLGESVGPLGATCDFPVATS